MTGTVTVDQDDCDNQEEGGDDDLYRDMLAFAFAYSMRRAQDRGGDTDLENSESKGCDLHQCRTHGCGWMDVSGVLLCLTVGSSGG